MCTRDIISCIIYYIQALLGDAAGQPGASPPRALKETAQQKIAQGC